MFQIRSLPFIIFFILETTASGLPWHLAYFYNDEFLIKTITDTISESKLYYRCDCRSNLEDCKNIIIVNYNNIFRILKLDHKNRIIDQKIIIKNFLLCNLARKIANEIQPNCEGILLHFCFLDKKADSDLVSKIVDYSKYQFRRVFIRNNIFADFNNREVINITLKESEDCDCFINHLIGDIFPKMEYKILNADISKSVSLKQFLNGLIGKSRRINKGSSDYSDVKEFFKEFYWNFADTKFFWNLLKYLFQDLSFGPYFVYFLDTSIYKNDNQMKLSTEQMCLKIKTEHYCDLKDREDWKKFACNTLYQLIFEVANTKKHGLLEHLISYNLMAEKNELIKLIKNKIRDRLKFYLKIVSMIMECQSEIRLRREFSKSKIIYNQIFIDNIRNIFFTKTETPSFTISLDVRTNKI